MVRSKDRKPLLICGARQVGKTYLLKEQFAKRFRDCITVMRSQRLYT